MHLKLDYCLTRIFIGRPFLFSNIKGLQAPSQSSTSKGPSGPSRNRLALITDCVEAALEIIDLCRLLRDEAGLARASFTEFSSCRAALLVILAQGLTKRTERLGAALDQGISLIKIMSMGVGSARSAVSVIEALERAIRRLEVWSESNQAQNNGSSTESAYDRFKNWEMLWKTGPVSPSTMVHKKQVAGATAPNPQHGAVSHGAAAPLPADLVAGVPITPPTTFVSASVIDTNVPIGTPDEELLDGDLSHWSFDHFVSNFPQELGEFTAIPCFETDAQGNSQSMAVNDVKPTQWQGGIE